MIILIEGIDVETIVSMDLTKKESIGKANNVNFEDAELVIVGAPTYRDFYIKILETILNI